MGKTNKLALKVRVTELNAVTDMIIAEYEKVNFSSAIYLASIFEEL